MRTIDAPMPRYEASLRKMAADSLLETADFAADILRQLERDGRLGRDSLAGKAIEAASRLQAAAALVREAAL